mgnify:CR=1 FL=1
MGKKTIRLTSRALSMVEVRIVTVLFRTSKFNLLIYRIFLYILDCKWIGFFLSLFQLIIRSCHVKFLIFIREITLNTFSKLSSWLIETSSFQCDSNEEISSEKNQISFTNPNKSYSVNCRGRKLYSNTKKKKKIVKLHKITKIRLARQWKNKEKKKRSKFTKNESTLSQKVLNNLRSENRQPKTDQRNFVPAVSTIFPPRN